MLLRQQLQSGLNGNALEPQTPLHADAARKDERNYLHHQWCLDQRLLPAPDLPAAAAAAAAAGVCH